LLASADAKRYRAALRVVLRDRGVDALLVMFVSPVMIDAEEVAEAIVERAAESSRPVLACIMGRQGGDEAQDLLVENGIPVFRYPEDAARTLRLMVRRWKMLARRPGKLPTFNVRKSSAGRVLKSAARKDGWLSGAEAEAVLAAYGIPFADSRRVRTPAAAVEAAEVLGFPVVLKAEAPGLLHKSDHLAVSIDLHDEEETFEAAADLIDRLRRRFSGMKLLVQRQAPGRLEVLLGMTRDERYGPLFVLGMGGIEVEALGDVALRIAPLDDRDPAEMIASLRGARLFEAFRGEPAVNSKAAQEGLMRLQHLVRDFPDIEEVEINPFILGSRGEPSLAVDARLRVRV
jgi:acetyltransferase